MAQGLQIWDTDGVLMLDYTQPTYTIYGSASTEGGANGEILDGRIEASKAFIIPVDVTYSGDHGSASLTEYAELSQYPYFTISDGTISWEYQSSTYGYIDVTFIYGGKP